MQEPIAVEQAFDECPSVLRNTSWVQYGRTDVRGEKRVDEMLAFALYTSFLLLRLIRESTPEYFRMIANLGYSNAKTRNYAETHFWHARFLNHFKVYAQTQQYILTERGHPAHPSTGDCVTLELSPDEKWAAARATSKPDGCCTILVKPALLSRYVLYLSSNANQRRKIEADIIETCIHETRHLFQGLPPKKTQASYFAGYDCGAGEKYYEQQTEITAFAAGHAAYLTHKGELFSPETLRGLVTLPGSAWEYYAHICPHSYYQEKNPGARGTARRYAYFIKAYAEAFKPKWEKAVAVAKTRVAAAW